MGAGLFRIASNSQSGQPSLVLSGVHATIAGVILGLVAPLRPKSPPEQLADNAQPLLKNFRSQILSNDKSSAEATLAELDLLVRPTDSIAERLERGIHPWVCFLVLPLFALASAGVALSAAQPNLAISSPIALGVFLGLILGKVLGIVLFSFRLCTRIRRGPHFARALNFRSWIRGDSGWWLPGELQAYEAVAVFPVGSKSARRKVRIE
jgi:Na+/H+ antiporter NhaA